ncbi:MAG: hypothetical protein IJZ90_02430 [Clostridia bacterium]|nr:hypothetical protein [Clostridia bacterium]
MAIDKENNAEIKYVYVILTRTNTGFANTIRRIMRRKYNHASISFTSDFKDIYAFARYQHKTPILAGLVREYPDRLTLKKRNDIACMIYKVPVTEEDYKNGLKKIKEIIDDPEGYLYNLFSVLSYPVTRGFSTYKAFSCSEFVAYLLRYMNINLGDKKTCSYTPWQLSETLDEYKYYEGDLIPLISECVPDGKDYFSGVNFFYVTGSSVKTLVKLLYRKCHR